MYHWLSLPHVARWWCATEPITPAQVASKYLPRIAGTVPTRCFIIQHAATPIGFIQTYRLADYPDYARQVGVDEPAAGVDLFIGEAAFLHRGLGAPIPRAFLRQIVFAQPGIVRCIIGPAVSNAAAIRAYEKAGFRYLRTATMPDEPEPEYIIRLTRADLEADPAP
jgi:RimJ/RimL family protein N-acetyltransferase